MRAGVALLAMLVLALGGAAGAGGGGKGYEVWTVDQSNTTGRRAAARSTSTTAPRSSGRGARTPCPSGSTWAAARTALCLARTGTAPVRPHMLFFNAGALARGPVVRRDRPRASSSTRPRGRRSRASTSGVAGARRRARARRVATSSSRTRTASCSQRIRTDYATNTFALEPAATLDLAGGTTPERRPAQDRRCVPTTRRSARSSTRRAGSRSSRCAAAGCSSSTRRATPMRIVAEYDRRPCTATAAAASRQAGDMYLNSGGGTAGEPGRVRRLRFPLGGLPPTPNPPNTPAPTLVFSHDGGHERRLARRGADASTAATCGWPTGSATGSWCIETRDRPGRRRDPARRGAEQRSDAGPHGHLADAATALRLAARPAAALGRPARLDRQDAGPRAHPGAEGRPDGQPGGIARIANADAAGIDRADPHGLRVRRK